MSSGMAAWRRRRYVARNQRALSAALAKAPTPAMEQELLSLASSRQWMGVPR